MKARKISKKRCENYQFSCPSSTNITMMSSAGGMALGGFTAGEEQKPSSTGCCCGPSGISDPTSLPCFVN